MIDIDMTEAVKRHGKHLLVMSQSDWNSFIELLKIEAPALYNELKEKHNFNMTPIDIDGRGAF